MAIQKDATYYHRDINSLISLVFIATFAFGAGLMIWNISFGENPVADGLGPAASAANDLAAELNARRGL